MQLLHLRLRSMLTLTALASVFLLTVAPLPAEPVLARVELHASHAAFNLPVHAHLTDATGQDYGLLIAEPAALAACGAPWQLLDPHATGATFCVAQPRRTGAADKLSNRKIKLNDGRHLILRAEPTEADALAAQGFELMWLNAPFAPARKTITDFRFTTDSHVAAMIDEVTRAELAGWVGDLSGERVIDVSGSTISLVTRHTASGVSLYYAEQYAFNHLQHKGLAPEFHSWNLYNYNGRKVIGTKPGVTSPTQIVLVTAHLDDMPPGILAPGADDNASGVAALLTAAAIASRHAFDRTLRFALFTGEEQGLLGSWVYAQALANRNENIVAVLNMDMLGWDEAAPPILQIHTRQSSNAGYAGDYAIAQLLPAVVQAYGLAARIVPSIQSYGENVSDHASFWSNGFPAVMLSEDYPTDFCKNYHTTNDKLATLNLDYLEAAGKSAVGIMAHLAGPADSRSSVPNAAWFAATLNQR